MSGQVITKAVIINALEAFEKEVPKIRLNQITCIGCPAVRICDLAFDLYNTDGDCLAEK